ncbi:MAG: GerW family sporulation protein [Clostridia bacterium]|nr:GerW family sporulation protein [Clostridia bacterium]
MEHPISKLMQTTLENIRDMVDVNTVIGEPIQTVIGATVIPFSKVSFGFATGGGEYDARKETLPARETLPFAGGSGAGVTVQPVGFLVIHADSVRLLPAINKTVLEQAISAAPHLVEDIKSVLLSGKEKKEG